MMRGMGRRLAGFGASVFAAMSVIAQLDAKEAGAQIHNDKAGGLGAYRGGPGNARNKRAALKKRNQARHRRACRS